MITWYNKNPNNAYFYFSKDPTGSYYQITGLSKYSMQFSPPTLISNVGNGSYGGVTFGQSKKPPLIPGTPMPVDSRFSPVNFINLTVQKVNGLGVYTFVGASLFNTLYNWVATSNLIFLYNFQ